MNIISTLLSVVVATLVLALGVLIAAPFVFAERALPGILMANVSFSGVAENDVAGILELHEVSLNQQQVRLRLREHEVKRTLADIGVSLNRAATQRAIEDLNILETMIGNRLVQPVLQINPLVLRAQTESDFSQQIDPPQKRLTDAFSRRPADASTQQERGSYRSARARAGAGEDGKRTSMAGSHHALCCSVSSGGAG